jgi:hypothetical protein
MAIQVIPVIKALTSVITTAGDMFAMWQAVRSQTAGATAQGRRVDADDAGAMAATLQESCAQNSRLIAEVAEQVRKLAIDLQAQGERIERRLKTAQTLALAAICVGIAALGAAFYAIHSVT